MLTRVLLDSRHIAHKSAPFAYHVRLEDLDIPVMKQVSKIEIKAVLFPKVANEAYVLLRMNDLWPSTLHTSSTSSSTMDCTTVVFFDHGAMSAGAYKPVKGSDLAIREVSFDAGVVHQFHVAFLKHDGTAIDPATDTNGQIDHAVVLEFTHA